MQCNATLNQRFVFNGKMLYVPLNAVTHPLDMPLFVQLSEVIRTAPPPFKLDESSQQRQDVHILFPQCWSNVSNAGPGLTQHRIK